MAAGDYYVIYEGDEWKVKLGGGQVLSAGHQTMQSAKREAERLGRNNDRGVVVNAKAGYTRYRKGPDEL